VATRTSGRAGARGARDRAAHRGAPARPKIILPGGAVMPAWYPHAPCARQDCACKDAFYPSDDQDARRARQICAGCPFRRRCLAYAIEHDECHGIWGGLDPDERRALRAGTPCPPPASPGRVPAGAPAPVTAPLPSPAAREGGTP